MNIDDIIETLHFKVAEAKDLRKDSINMTLNELAALFVYFNLKNPYANEEVGDE